MNRKICVVISSVSGFLAVAIGAFGAHALKRQIAPEMYSAYETGVLYHLIHSAVLLSLALYGKKYFNLPFILFTAGIVLFSFSLYAYSLTQITFLAIITPFGGICFLGAWIMLGISAYKNETNGN